VYQTAHCVDGNIWAQGTERNTSLEKLHGEDLHILRISPKIFERSNEEGWDGPGMWHEVK
jgi:hypothetical protein